MIRCVIIDDEPLAQDVLEEHLKQIPYAQLDGKFNNAWDALRFLANHEVDAIFLDIEMPEMNGIDFLKSLSPAPLTIFTTAYRNYAFEGFELGVIDFLLKPVAFNRFRMAIEKVRDFLSLQAHNASFEASSNTPEFIFVKSGVQRIKLFFDEVTYIQGLKDYAIIYTPDKKIVIKGSVKSMHEIFPITRFIRVHKSFIVAKDKISRIEKNRVVISDHQIPIGRNYKEEVEKEISGN
ncbi:LytTR family DNA-binding domain-containing protein [Mucilaginibacter sp.]|uniref:LytR/AlgR family response regulator transcription factor n=1 Tax=Mucilaginibacter sp. TaxID=1882438 RepID=UPI002631B30B|nr:LytTR family DNA-binding domain-containing protein [Mucilaginibacter sp.]MDB4919023.1 two component transcriptional regulator, LytTR family [Mucilaginibacter sp.]